ncbi:unnamed protein product [Phyllotreta striolata]|uniref:Single domain-containing protein n=1 Tax=Phyllotreta striolata TaxID=444603 RepID=A0A9N9TGG3_PHYSR|nr:unnamed protein product [Phyllotreta striolata]
MNKVEFAMSNLVLVLLLFIVPAYGETWGIKSEIEKAPPGGCYSSYGNLGALEKGESRRLVGQCALAFCSNREFIGVIGCGLSKESCRNGKPAKKLPGDLLLEYPRCCPELLCPENV